MGGSFSYVDEDASRIFTGVLGSRDVLTETSAQQLTRKLETFLQKSTAMDLHEVTLAKYYKLQLISRGLRVRIIPILFAQNGEFKTKFTQIINKCSFDLMTLTVQFLQTEQASLTQQISELETQLTDLM